MITELIKEIAELEAAATPGPWVRFDNAGNHWGMREVIGPAVKIRGFSLATDVSLEEGRQIGVDCDFIAALRNAAPDLLLHVADLTARLAAETEARERAERERDAYHRAKDENDDRFMRERDEAREAAAEYQRRLAAVMVAFGSPERGTDLAAEIIGMRTELATVREWLGMATRFESKDRGVFIDLECGMWGLYLSTGDVITYSKYPSIDATFAALKSP